MDITTVRISDPVADLQVLGQDGAEPVKRLGSQGHHCQ
jgi:hypothetical protein